MQCNVCFCCCGNLRQFLAEATFLFRSGDGKFKMLIKIRWDALIFGGRKWIPSPPCPKPNALHFFERRPPHLVAEKGFTAHNDFINHVKQNIDFRIDTGEQDEPNPVTGFRSGCNAQGSTQYSPSTG